MCGHDLVCEIPTDVVYTALAEMGHEKKPTFDSRQLAVGAALQVVEGATLGMPLEVWKTRQGSVPSENARQSLRAVHRNGGLSAFWRGSGAKFMESASKGGILLYAKEGIIDVADSTGAPLLTRGSAASGALGGLFGGVCQTITMAPLTYIVTYKMHNPEHTSWSTARILRAAGFRQAYASASAVAMRQGSNWMLRQGFADGLTHQYELYKGAKANKSELIACGVAGGCLACINQPFEVLRIRVQAEQARGNSAATVASCARTVMKESGILGLYAGIIPRCCLASWQTVFMVSFAHMAREYVAQYDASRIKV